MNKIKRATEQYIQSLNQIVQEYEESEQCRIAIKTLNIILELKYGLNFLASMYDYIHTDFEKKAKTLSSLSGCQISKDDVEHIYSKKVIEYLTKIKYEYTQKKSTRRL